MANNVTIKSSQSTFIVDDHETILDAALKQGIALPYGCRDGACGSCKTKIESGEIYYSEDDLSGISIEEKENGYGLMCKAHANSDILLDARLADSPETIKIRKLPCRVMHIDTLSHDVMRLKIKLPKTERLAFLAGQYIDILMSDGEKRSFSLANAPHDDEFLELHIRYYEGGVFSEYAFNHLEEKTLMRIEGPHGSFYFREDSDRPIIMVAGGTGFAPIKSIIEHVIASSLERPIDLYWGARGKMDLYLGDLAQGWAEQHELIKYTPVLSEPDDGDDWDGRTGFVHETVLADFSDISDYEVYTCGPPPMTKAVCENFSSRGLAEKYIFSDSFEFAPRK